MFLARIELLEQHLRGFVKAHYGVELDRLMVERPPRPEFGDVAFPFPFELAKSLRKAPRAIAQEVASQIGPLESVERMEAAGAGYVNAFFRKLPFLEDLARWVHAPFPASRGSKVIVEHTNINPNKAAHIGHLRNAALGDTFVRILRAAGHTVEVQNYIDNTGVQVADVVVGFHQLRGLSLAEVEQIGEPFDYYCWDLYAEVSDWYGQEPSRTRYRQEALQAIEEGHGETARLGEHIATRIVRAHLATMHRIGVEYDVLPRESEILQLKFWDTAFRQLKESGAIFLAEDGPQKGCWVMRLPGEAEEAEAEEKIIVRSNGTVTYVGKDIAYQLWKFGLLNRDFHYRLFHRYPGGHEVWVSSIEPEPESKPDFGHGHQVYNVIDVRQSYLQRVVVQGLRSLGFEEQADRSIHFAYEMVALSPACCSELGIELSAEDQARPYVEVSGRKGLGVKADDLVDKLIEKSLTEVERRQQEMPVEQRLHIARQIAVGALRYFLLKYTRNAVIAFDFNEALSFEGETGPYLQYSVVRANNIFRKAEAADIPCDREARLAGLVSQAERTGELLSAPEIWELLLLVARIDEVIDQSIRTMEVTHLAKHAFTLAQRFNIFYHNHHILSEPDSSKRDLYLMVADLSRQGLVKLLSLLGIEVPEKM